MLWGLLRFSLWGPLWLSLSSTVSLSYVVGPFKASRGGLYGFPQTECYCIFTYLICYSYITPRRDASDLQLRAWSLTVNKRPRSLTVNKRLGVIKLASHVAYVILQQRC